MQHQRRNRVVERTVIERQAIAKVAHMQGYVVTEIAGDRAEVRCHRGRAGVDSASTQHIGTVGVRPERQGLGLGKAVIEYGLRAADRQRQPAYLETSLAANVELHRTLGFHVTAEIELPAHGPITWAMYREPMTITE